MGTQPMEIRPPCVPPRVSSASARLETASSTHSVAVVAADGRGGALVAGADADDGDRRAVEADQRVDGAEDDAEQTEDD